MLGDRCGGGYSRTYSCQAFQPRYSDPATHRPREGSTIKGGVGQKLRTAWFYLHPRLIDLVAVAADRIQFASEARRARSVLAVLSVMQSIVGYLQRRL